MSRGRCCSFWGSGLIDRVFFPNSFFFGLLLWKHFGAGK
jgi:hypothetical protein